LLIFKGIRERSSGGSMPEVSSRNTRHESWHKSLHLSLLCIPAKCGATPCTHTSDKNRRRIFLRPVPSKKIFPFGNIAGQGFGFTGKFSGCKDRPYRNFKTDVAEGKQRGHVRSKTPASRDIKI